jgi:hypothetical protein
MNEAAFDLPAGFTDRTINHLEASAEDGSGIAILVERARLPDGTTLREAVSRRIGESRARWPNFSVLFEHAAIIAESEAIDVGTRWRHDEGMVYTRQLHTVLNGVWLILTGETALEDRELCDRTVDHVAASLRRIQ